MATLNELVHEVVKGYSGEMLNGFAYLTTSPDLTVFSVICVADDEGTRLVEPSLLVRIEHDQVVIEYDDNSKPLVDALVQAGLQRNQIVLAYAGEALPKAV